MLKVGSVIQLIHGKEERVWVLEKRLDSDPGSVAHYLGNCE